MPIKINWRRKRLPELRSMHDWLKSMIAIWGSPPSLVWYDAGDGRGGTWQLGPSGAGRRKRADIPAIEYPENNPARLHQLIKYMTAIELQASAIATEARSRLAELESGR